MSATTTTTAAETTTLTTAAVPAVVVSLDIPLLPPEKLYPTPSLLDGLPYEVEFDLRLTGCELIQTAGRLLKLPQTAMASAQILFHRYFYTKSFVKSNMEQHAMAAIFLSSKVQECPRRIRDVMNVFNHIKQLRSGKVIKPMTIDAVYSETKNKVIKAERQMLKDLGFCVHFKHPHKIIFIYLQAIECSQTVDLSQKAWNYMNDSMRTDIFLRYTPQNIACACIYLSARELKISLPESPPWYVMFGADEETIKAICVRILHLYTHQVKPQEELEKIVVESREKLYEDKRKAREAAAPAAVADKSGPGVEDKPPPSAKTADAIIQEAKKLLMKDDESKRDSASAIISNLRAAKAHSNTPPPIGGLPVVSKYSSGHEHVPQVGACPPPSFYASQSAHPMTRHSSFNNQYPGHFYPPAPAPHHSHHYPHPPPYLNGHGYNGYGAENGGGGGGGDYYEYGHDPAASSLKKNKSASALTTYGREHDDQYYKQPRHTGVVSRSSSRRHGTRSRSRSPSRRHAAEKRHHRSRSRNRGGPRRSSSKGRSIENDSSSAGDSDSDGKHHKRKKSSHKSSSHSSHHHHHSGRHKDESRERSRDDRRYRDRHDKESHSASSSSSRPHHRSSHKSSSKSKQRDSSSSRRGEREDAPAVVDSIASMPVYIQ